MIENKLRAQQLRMKARAAGYRIILKEGPMKLIRLIAATAGAFAFAQCSAAVAANIDISAHDIGGQVTGEKGDRKSVV